MEEKVDKGKKIAKNVISDQIDKIPVVDNLVAKGEKKLAKAIDTVE